MSLFAARLLRPIVLGLAVLAAGQPRRCHGPGWYLDEALAHESARLPDVASGHYGTRQAFLIS